MPKGGKQSQKNNGNKALNARVSYMFEAATYLAQAANKSTSGLTQAQHDSSLTGTSHRLINQLRMVARKSQIRVSIDIKRATCKRCDALLIPVSGCSVSIENQSKGRKKPWADVRVVECSECGAKKRFPVGARKQERKAARAARRAAMSQVVEEAG